MADEDFSTATTLQVEVDQGSLRAARAEVEDALGSVTAEATATNQLAADSGGGEVAGILENNLGLDQTRNELLRDILDAQQMTARNSGGGGGILGSVGGTIGAIGGGAVGIAVLLASQIMSVDWTSVIGDAIPDIGPEDVIDAVEVTLSDLVGDGLPAVAADVVDDSLPVGVEQLLATTPLLTVGAILADAFPINPGDIIGNPSGGGSPSGKGSPGGSGAGGGLPILEALGGGALGAGLFRGAQKSGLLGKVLGASSGGMLFTRDMFKNTAFGDLTYTKENYPGMFDGKSLDDLAQNVFGGIFSSSGGSGGSTSPVGQSPAVWNSPGVGSGTAKTPLPDKPMWARGASLGTGAGVGGFGLVQQSGSNRNETNSNREQTVRLTGNITIDLNNNRNIEQQLRRQGIPDWMADELARKIGRDLNGR